jgi:hypothetical protein
VLKELAMFALVYNLIRLVMIEAARRQEVAVDRISFVDALRWLRSAKPDSPMPNSTSFSSPPHVARRCSVCSVLLW